MNAKIALALAALGGMTASQGAVLVYEGFDYTAGSDEITLTWKSNPGEFYGLYWSGELTSFEPGIDPAIPAHATANRTTYGPFANPSAGAASLFLRFGLPDLADPTLQNLWGNATTISLSFSEAMHATAATNPANFAVMKDGGGPVTVTAASLSPDGKTIELTMATSLDIGSSYTAPSSPPTPARSTARPRCPRVVWDSTGITMPNPIISSATPWGRGWRA